MCDELLAAACAYPLHSSGADHRICDLSMIVLLLLIYQVNQQSGPYVLLFCLLVQSRADSVAPMIPTVLVGDRLAVSSPMLHVQTRSWPAAEEVQDTLEKSVLLNVPLHPRQSIASSLAHRGFKTASTATVL